MNTYQKVAKLRDDTIFELKLIKRNMETQIDQLKRTGGDLSYPQYVLMQLKGLFALYEIEIK